MIPPPRLNSYTDDLLAPLPKDYMRTPSSDMEECHLMQHSQAEVELRRKVREQAIKVWGKKHHKDALPEGEENEGNLLDEECHDSDVFYTKDAERKSSESFFMF